MCVATAAGSVQPTPVAEEATAAVWVVVAWVVADLVVTAADRTATHLDQADLVLNHHGGKRLHHRNPSGFFAITLCVFLLVYLIISANILRRSNTSS